MLQILIKFCTYFKLNLLDIKTLFKIYYKKFNYSGMYLSNITYLNRDYIVL